MEVVGRYHDGVVADVRDVACRLEPGGQNATLVIADRATGEEIDRWRAEDLFPLHHRRHELRVGVMGKPYGARLAFAGYDQARAAGALLKHALAHKHRQERSRQYRAIGLATVALVSVIVAYVYGVPLLAGQIVGLVPPQWEEALGETVVAQIEQALKEEAGWAVCDPDPGSLANGAIRRFAAQAVAGTGTPFTPDIKVIRTSIPNAFALPGGRSFYFSALLDQTESPEEFAGVMAHELGHVVHRHGMEQLVSTSATGLLVGFVLGDMTGLSIAGALGAALIDSRFSREAEREADRFAADAAQRLSFRPAGLANLLERVAGDDEFTAALALLSTHPLTTERRAYLESLAVDEGDIKPVFTAAEWRAIKAMCEPAAAQGRGRLDGSPASKSGDKGG
jgi:Zn-dependent protease with chaperone function